MIWSDLWDVLLLRDYNTRVVLLGVALLGAASGLVGSFTLLRKRSLMGDALAHASLPGLVIAFMIAVAAGGDGKSMPLLLAGATMGGLAGVACILFLQRFTKLKQDATLGIVLSVFFGLGVVLLGMTQRMDVGNSAGLETYIFGKTASMRRADGIMIAITALISILVTGVLFKELKLLCFDADFAGSRGLRVWLLDTILMVLVVMVTMVGLQAVGLVLMVAMLVIPAAAARFWTESIFRLAVISASIGMVGSVMGAAASAVMADLPSGAMIVLACAMLFGISMFFGTKRGVIPRLWRRRQLNAKIARQHLLRGIYELSEAQFQDTNPGHWVSMADLLQKRSWNSKQLHRQIETAQLVELVRYKTDQVALTSAGYAEAARLTRQHRLWELYLVHYADVATARVDRDADDIEHVLEHDVVEQLERLLEQAPIRIAVPSSPHAMEST